MCVENKVSQEEAGKQWDGSFLQMFWNSGYSLVEDVDILHLLFNSV